VCGIVGALQYKSDVERVVRKKALQIIFTETMLKTEPRGDDATGLYQVHADGDWMLTKKGEKVTTWLEANSGKNDPAVYQDFVDTWNSHPHELKALVGHCRKATIGSKGTDNDDNHPFAVQLDERNAILGIHNGTLNNHEIVFNKLKELSNSHLIRQGSVDSEAIFHMMYHVTEYGTKPVDGDMLRYMGKRLDGAYACIIVNSRFPNQVVTFRDGRPVEYLMISPLNVVLVASDKKFIESAMEKYNFIRRWTEAGKDLPELKVEYRTLLEKDYRIFDLSKPFPKILGWNAFDAISERGVMLDNTKNIETDWKASTAKTTFTSQGFYCRDNNVYTRKAVTPTVSKALASGEKTTSSEEKIDSSNTTAVVSAEIKKVELGSEEEAKAVFQKAKLLGLCPAYDMPREIAGAIGVSEAALKDISEIELANRLGQTHFNMGYAIGRVDSQHEIDNIRKKAREQHGGMEKNVEKQKRAEKHIWELKQLSVISMALAESEYPIALKNIEIVLDNYTKYSKERINEIMNTAQSLFKDQGARRQISNLIADFKLSEKKKAIAAGDEKN